MRSFALTLALIFGLVAQSRAQSDMTIFDTCLKNSIFSSPDLQRIVFACSRLIGDPALPAGMRSDALVQRALARPSNEYFERLADLQSAFKLKPDSEILMIRILYLLLSNNTVDGLADAREIVRIEPSRPAGYVLGGMLHEKNPSIGILELNKGLDLPNERMSIRVERLFNNMYGLPARTWLGLGYLVRGMHHKTLGDRKSSAADLRKALMFEPENTALREAVSKVLQEN